MTALPKFYTNPEMTGHFWAKESYDFALETREKYVKTQRQKMLFDSAIGFNEDWHYWIHIANMAHLRRVRAAVRAIEKLSPMQLLRKVRTNHPQLKTDLLRWTELNAYANERENFVSDYCATLKFFGMGESDAMARCEKYMVGLQKYNYQIPS